MWRDRPAPPATRNLFGRACSLFACARPWSEPANATDGGARAWNATAVQRWFEEHKDGKWEKYAGKFAELNGEEMSELSEEAFLRSADSAYGSAMYNDWRVTCCAAGWADALWSPGGAALALVGGVWEVRSSIQRAAVQAKFVAFADALRRQKREQLTAGDVVDFGAPTLNDKHMFEGPSKIYVRECYVPLLEDYFNDDIDKTRCRIVIGNPGIGKSMFRLLVTCKALAEGLDVAFVKFDGDDHKTYIVSAHGQHDRVLAKGASIGDHHRADAMVVVADVGKGDLRLVEDIHSPRRWYFTSNSKIDRDARKSGNTFLWLPLWTHADQQEAARLETDAFERAPVAGFRRHGTVR